MHTVNPNPYAPQCLVKGIEPQWMPDPSSPCVLRSLSVFIHSIDEDIISLIWSARKLCTKCVYKLVDIYTKKHITFVDKKKNTF